MIRIAVLLTCYNRVETTLRCLRQLFAQELPAGCVLDVYLVDDASPDRTGELVKATFPLVNVIASRGGLFWCRGMRLAWDTAIKSGIDYDFYLWVNDDVQFYGGAICGLLNDYEIVLRRDGAPGLIVGTFAPSDENQRATYGLMDFNYIVAQPDGSPRWIDGINMNGNLVLVSRAIYGKIGPIYGGYYHGAGDSDYRLMAKEHGIKAYCSSCLSGICPREPERYTDPRSKPFFKRLSVLFDPKGMPIHDTFIYRYRHWGLVRAIVSVCHVVFLAVFPRKRK